MSLPHYKHSDYLLRLFMYIGIPGLVLSLLFSMLQIPYALLFFGLFSLQILSFEQPGENPEHSSTTHFERFSRWNWYNYTVSALICSSALLFVMVPLINRALLVALLWIACIFVLRQIEMRMHTLLPELVAAYIAEQMPELGETKPRQIVNELDEITQPDKAMLTEKFQISAEQAEQIIHYYQTYLEQNSLND